ncbi:MAG TPA: hypothetical protein VF425_04300, partial [Thermoanaerobaculia bacterium]
VQSATAAAVVESGATPASTAPAALTAVAAAAPAPAAIAGPVLRLEATPSEVAPGAVSVVNLTGEAGLDALGALELTIEWDPVVAEVTGIAPGPWRSAFGGDMVRLDADRVAGRAQLHFKRVGGAGLPAGVLATLAVRGLAPGTTLMRATAGTASTTGGATPTPSVEAASLTVKPVP